MSRPNLAASLSNPTRTARLATWALIGIAYFVVAVAALHILRPDYPPIRTHMSAYAVGPYGFLMTAAFFALAAASLSLASGLWQGASASSRSKLGSILLGIFGIGLAIAGIFPTDLEGAPRTSSGDIHELAFLVASVSVVVALILLSRNFTRDERWRDFGRTAMTLAILALLAFIVLFATADLGFLGLGQRLFVALVLAWLILTAMRLRSLGMTRG